MRVYGWVLDEWLTVLRDHRGLAPNSVDLYRRNVEPFLEDLGADASRDDSWHSRPSGRAPTSNVRPRDWLE